jgi:hypothetical protein
MPQDLSHPQLTSKIIKGMKIYRVFITLSFLFIVNSIQAQVITITGSGSGYQGAELRFFFQSDPITKRLKPLFNINCDEKGSFSCEVPCKETELIFIKAGIFCFSLYVTEGSKYEILFPDFISKTRGEEQNPFFIETKLIPQVINVPDDINNLIKVFDAEYNPIFNNVAKKVFDNFQRAEIPGLVEKLNQISDIKGPKFYSDYVKYRRIMLNQVAFGEYPGQVEDSTLINERFVSENQAFLDLIEQMFAGYFRNISSGPLKESFNRAIALSSFKDLKAIIFKDGKAIETQLQEYIILLNLYDEFYSKSIPLENVIHIISDIRSDGSSFFIKKVASIILEKLQSGLPGKIPPDFSLLNSEGRQVSLKDFGGKYLIISFTRADNPATAIEFSIMNLWYKKYMNDMEIVTILTDKDFEYALSEMKSNDFQWIFLNGSSSEFLEYQYDVRMYPTFLVLDRENRIVADPAPFPSENLEPLIRKIIQEDKNRSDSKNR